MEVILLLDSSGNRVLDSVAAEYEDSFSLEEFGDLVRAHASAEPKGEKAFIMARVQTFDPKHPEKTFYSYYNAYHLNKILFQTQVYLGKKLIHRLHVLNPLSNTDIIGNIQYFMVRNSTVSNESKEVNKLDALRKRQVSSPIAKAPLVDIVSYKGNHFSSSLKLLDTSVSPTVMEVEANAALNWTRSSPAVAEILPEDQNGPNRGRKVSGFVRRVSNSLSPRKTGSPQNIALPPYSEVEVKKAESDFSERVTSVSERGALAVPVINGNRRQTVFNIKEIEQITKLPSEPLRLMPNGSSQRKTAPVLPGIITQFAIPISAEKVVAITPTTAKSRRRSLSYANAVSAVGVEASLEEWVNMIKEERTTPELASDNVTDYDTVKQFGRGSPISPLREETILESEDENCVHEAAKGPSKDETDTVNTFEAILFATDNDFLESARIRMIFRQNAIQADDVKLFEMKPYLGPEGESPVVVIVEEPEEPLCTLCYPNDQSLSQSTQCMRTFHKLKFYVAAFALMLALFFL